MNKYIAMLATALIVTLVTMMATLSAKTEQKSNLEGLQKATFAGGCFWCVEADFEKLNGVKEVISGYTGGEVENPSYRQVSAGKTGHREAVQVYYDNEVLSYSELVQYFFQHIDPTDARGSFVDRGKQYTSAIFFANSEEEKMAMLEIKRLSEAGVFTGKIETEVVPLKKFYQAEDYHQNYHQRHAWRYRFYRGNSGRDDFLKGVWQSGDKKVRKYLEEIGGYDLSRLSELQYRVTQKDATEKPFDNAYWDNKKDGLYVDIVSGEPLFSSLDKYDSGTGWPSFTKPISKEVLVEKKDKKLFIERTEVRSARADSHLGHVFDDGPKPERKRYCINSAALDFIPKNELLERGYGKYLEIFDKKV